MKKRVDAWLTSAGELPPARVLKSEPRLQNLESNAVFRLIALRRSIGPHFLRGLTLFRLLIAASALLLFAVDVPDALATLAWTLFAGFYIGSFTGTLTRLVNRWLLSMGNLEPYLEDLSMAGMPAEDFTIAMWGASVSRRRILYHIAESALDVAIFFSCVLLISRVDAAALIRWLFFNALFWASSNAGMLRYVPYPMLSQTLRSVVPLADVRDTEINSLDLIWGFTNGLVFMTLNGILPLVWWGGISAVNRWPNTVGSVEISFVCATLCMLAGAAWGQARGLYMKRCANLYLKIISEHVSQFLDRWSASREETASQARREA